VIVTFEKPPMLVASEKLFALLPAVLFVTTYFKITKLPFYND